MNLSPEIRIHPDNGQKIYFYSIAQFEYIRNQRDHREYARRAGRENPYQPIGGQGRRTERYGNRA